MDEKKEFWEKETEEEKEKRKQERKRVKLRQKPRINLNPNKTRNGLAQLVLTVVELLRELMEKQAIRRIEGDSLNEEQIENLGNTFKRLKEEIEKLKNYFQLEEEDLNLDLGPIRVREEVQFAGEKKTSAVEILDRLIGKGVVVRGDVVISVAEVDLISLNLGLLLASVDKAKELYGSTSSAALKEEVAKLKAENERLKKK